MLKKKAADRKELFQQLFKLPHTDRFCDHYPWVVAKGANCDCF
jgi:hypothetical protein